MSWGLRGADRGSAYAPGKSLGSLSTNLNRLFPLNLNLTAFSLANCCASFVCFLRSSRPRTANALAAAAMSRACRRFECSSYSSQSLAQNESLVLWERLWTRAFCCFSSSVLNHRRHSADLEAATDAFHLCCIAAGRPLPSKARKGKKAYNFFLQGFSWLLVVATSKSGTKMACWLVFGFSWSIGMADLARSRTKDAALSLAWH